MPKGKFYSDMVVSGALRCDHEEWRLALPLASIGLSSAWCFMEQRQTR